MLPIGVTLPPIFPGIVVSGGPTTVVIAGGNVRAVMECLGVHDVLAKNLGSNNPHNVVKATFQALQSCVSPRGVAARRGKKIGEIVARRGDQQAGL